MAIEKLDPPKNGRDGRVYRWRVRFRPRAGRAGSVTLFETRPEAKRWQAKEREQEITTKRGLHSNADLKRYTVRDIVRSYAHLEKLTEDDDLYNDKETLKESTELPYNQFLVLWKFSGLKICESSLYDFDERAAEQYRDSRLKDTYTAPGSSKVKQVTPRTVKREITTIQKAWKWARRNYPDLPHLENPWKEIRVKGSTKGRRRRSLEKDELRQLASACEKCLGLNRFYVPLAIYLAVETAMRLQEVMNLTWQCIDFKKRRITILRSKTSDGPAEIVLSPMASWSLAQLGVSLRDLGRLPGPARMAVEKRARLLKGKIFPMTSDALTQAFTDAVARAGIKQTTFHDLRRTANMNFIKAGLTLEERNVMMRHEDDTMNQRYTDEGDADVLRRIQDKLDIYTFGKTWDEAMNDAEKYKRDIFVEGLKMGLGENQAHFRVDRVIAKQTVEVLAKARETRSRKLAS